MKTCLKWLAAMWVFPAAARTIAAEGEAEQSDLSPVERVESLLYEIKSELEKEAAADSDTWKQQSCWCKTTEEEKTTAISDADAKIASLEETVQSSAAKDGGLGVNIDDMKKQIAADQETLKSATAIREKESADFNAQEKQMVQDISNLKNAIEVLSKHHESNAASFLQENSPEGMSFRTVLRDISARFAIVEARLGLHHDSSPASAGRTAFLDENLAGSQKNNVSLGSVLLGFLGKSNNVLPVSIAAKRLKDLAGQAAKSTSPTFLQTKQAPLSSAAHLGHYSTQSSQVWGILNQMLETLQADLSEMQEDELQARKAYKGLATAKANQIDLGKGHLDQMQEMSAGNGQSLADAKDDLERTHDQRAADVEYLAELKLTCQNLTTEWGERSATRAEEIKAVTEALAILREDDNREHLDKTFSFLQSTSSHARSSWHAGATERMLRAQAAATLRRVAEQPNMDMSDLVHDWDGRNSKSSAVVSHSNRLATLAISAQLDDFKKVKEAIDIMVSDLKAEQDSEVQFKQYCVDGFDKYEKNIYDTNEERKDTEAEINSLDVKITSLQGEIDAAHEAIAKNKLDIKSANEAREKENAAFQTTVSDQREAQKILADTWTRLESFYKTKAGAPSLAQKASAQPTPPVHFNDYETNAGTPAAMSLIESIIEDSKALEKEAMAAEDAAQSSYEEYVKSCTASIAELEGAIRVKSRSKAIAGEDKSEASKHHASVMDALEDLTKAKADLHGECDFVVANFDIRQKARLDEIEALQSAKAILSGST